MISPVLAELEAAVQRLDSSRSNCRIEIVELRREMDGLCDQGKITIAEWRKLLDRISIIQSQCTR